VSTPYQQHSLTREIDEHQQVHQRNHNLERGQLKQWRKTYTIEGKKYAVDTAAISNAQHTLTILEAALNFFGCSCHE
jgi:hypothetical protein